MLATSLKRFSRISRPIKQRLAVKMINSLSCWRRSISPSSAHCHTCMHSSEW